jgi:serine/threonine protein kinase
MPRLPLLDPEDRLQEAVLAYLHSTDCGRPLDPHTLLERYADISTQLQAFLDDEACVTSLLSPLATPECSHHAPHDAYTGQLFGRYELLAEIGRGGMGVVYKARQQDIDRLVAIKIVRARSQASPADLQRFRNETQTVAGLEHPHIVPIYDVGEHEGQLYYTMPLLDGGSLPLDGRPFCGSSETAALAAY